MSLIYFSNANSRPNYFTVHNIAEAHKHTKGKNIKVGVIDWLFAVDEYKVLYTNAIDFTQDPHSLYKSNGHGLWMATVLREIAPECEIYALNAIKYNEEKSAEENDFYRSEYIISAIEWAIENNIDILTYSHPKFTQKYYNIVNEAIDKAIKHGIMTSFIHNDNINNIWSYGCFEYYGDTQFNREPDINIYHYDYNTLYIPQYERYKSLIENSKTISSGNDLPYFSFSSMAQVAGGFAALLKSLNRDLNPRKCKEILMKTSYDISEKNEHWYDINSCPRVADIGKAVQYILQGN